MMQLRGEQARLTLQLQDQTRGIHTYSTFAQFTVLQPRNSVSI
jgi:hypothetical protein